MLHKRAVQQGDITFKNIYASNIGAPKPSIKLKGKTDSNIIIVEDFSTPLTSMDGSSRQEISKEIPILNDRPDGLKRDAQNIPCQK